MQIKRITEPGYWHLKTTLDAYRREPIEQKELGVAACSLCDWGKDIEGDAIAIIEPADSKTGDRVSITIAPAFFTICQA